MQLKGHLKEGAQVKVKDSALSVENFEDLIQDCFEEVPCDVPDAWKIYQHFKSLKNKAAVYNLMRFLIEKKMILPSERHIYKDVLKRMIEDFYKDKDLLVPMAEYFMLTEEREKALDLYLTWRKKNPARRSDFDLGIANLYYDMGRYQEALSYYRSSYEAIRKDYDDKNQVPALEYINNRINDISERLK